MNLKKYQYHLFFGALVALILLLIYLRVEDAVHGVPFAAPEQIEKKLEDLNVQDLQQTRMSEDATASISVDSEKTREAFEKCFKKSNEPLKIENIFRVAEKYRDFSDPMVIEENYEIKTSGGDNYVVQYIPAEDDNEKVRVFSINPADQLPDRIKDFPQSSAKPTDRLAGALSMGPVVKKTVSTNQTSYDGALLSVDKENGTVTRFHLVGRDFDFECKNNKCICLKK